jgi:hypothetical protein
MNDVMQTWLQNVMFFDSATVTVSLVLAEMYWMFGGFALAIMLCAVSQWVRALKAAAQHVEM